MRPKYVPVKLYFLQREERQMELSGGRDDTCGRWDGAAITVYRQNGTEENWTLTVQTDTAAEARAVIRQIDSLPDAADLTLEDADAVKTARTAFEALGEEEKECA